MKQDDGGPAFPSPAQQGMSLRDWFAGMAMQSIISIDATVSDSEFASWGYEIADAMLKERAK
jgi:hypothetical protein